jgi:hypothetical protein
LITTAFLGGCSVSNTPEFNTWKSHQQLYQVSNKLKIGDISHTASQNNHHPHQHLNHNPNLWRFSNTNTRHIEKNKADILKLAHEKQLGSVHFIE